MLRMLTVLGVGSVLMFTACSLPDQEVRVYTASYSFLDTDEGWTGDFADYAEGDSVANQLVFKYDKLAYNLNSDSTLKALILSGTNEGDDLFMFLKKKVTGLQANTVYQVLFKIKVASNVPTGVVGLEAPGDSVYLKVGATTIEPKKQIVDDQYRMNIDKGNLNVGGADMLTIGSIGVGTTTSAYTYIYRNNSSSNSFFVTTDDQGELWLIVGTDSGFEGSTTLYYTQVDVFFNEIN